jgi:hypothetical protein
MTETLPRSETKSRRGVGRGHPGTKTAQPLKSSIAGPVRALRFINSERSRSQHWRELIAHEPRPCDAAAHQ